MKRTPLIVLLAVIGLIASGCNLYTWGGNAEGQIGNDTTIDALVPVNINAEFDVWTDWDVIAPGARHTCGIRMVANGGGQLWCWGLNNDSAQQGSLGIGTLVENEFRPARVGTASDWAHVSAGNGHTCAVKTNQTLWCWGDNDKGQVGDGSTTDRFSPVQVQPGTQWANVDTGGDFTCGIQSDQSMWCWGDNTDDRLGSSPGSAQRAVPTAVGDPIVNWTDLSSGPIHTCAVRGNDTLWCWGTNNDGQLGDGTRTASTTPVQAGSAANWQQVDTGSAHSCAVNLVDQLWCWGDSEGHQLGFAQRTDVLTPRRTHIDESWSSVTAGAEISCGVRTDDPNLLWCWGRDVYDTFGEIVRLHLPAGHFLFFYNQETPVVGRSWNRVDLDHNSFCGVKINGRAACSLKRYVADSNGQQGLGSPSDGRGLADVGERSPFREVSAGGAHTCGVRSDDTLWCWGSNDRGQLGDGTTVDRDRPVEVFEGVLVRTIAAGRSHTCATTLLGPDVYCWGDNTNGQAAGAGNLVLTPRQVTLPTGQGTFWSGLTTGGGHSCTSASDGQTTYCWGGNDRGQLGDGTTTNRRTPIRMNADYSNISAGESHTCGTRRDFAAGDTGPSMWCWGANGHGQLGDGTTTDRLSPVKLFGQNWAGVSAGLDHTCGVRNNGIVSCTGNNDRGQLGDGTTIQRLRPVPIEVGWSRVTVGDRFTCATKRLDPDDDDFPRDYRIWCWGANDHGQLGEGSTTDRLTPTPVATTPTVGWVDAGGSHVVASTNDRPVSG